MMVRILPEAESELLAAAAWYEDRENGVGVRFLEAYEMALQSIQVRGETLPRDELSPADHHIQRSQLRRFPYRIVFEIFDDTAVILAIPHSSQRPLYWIERRIGKRS